MLGDTLRLAFGAAVGGLAGHAEARRHFTGTPRLLIAGRMALGASAVHMYFLCESAARDKLRSSSVLTVRTEWAAAAAACAGTVAVGSVACVRAGGRPVLALPLLASPAVYVLLVHGMKS